MPQYVVCVPATGDAISTSVAPCSDAGGMHLVPVMMEFPAPGQVNFDNSQTLFAYGFIAVLVFWGLGVCVGAILSVIKRDH